MSISPVGWLSSISPVPAGTNRSGSTGGSASAVPDSFGPAVQVSLSGAGSADNAIEALTKAGLKSPTVDYAGAFKQQIFKIADGNQDGSLSQSELEQQVVAGGGAAADADALYQAMGGTTSAGVSEQQLSQNLATPVDNNFGDQLMKLVDPNRTMTKAELEQLLLQSGNTQQQANSLAADVGVS